MNSAIYTEKTQCRDCYKCIRHCPVKAIRVEESSATIDHDLCIFCGRCVDVCPAGAKKIRNDIPRVRQLLSMKKDVYVSLAPSFPAVFPGGEEELLQSLLQLGFAGVSETALGAEIVTREQKRALEEGAGIAVSSACPTVRMLARRYFPAAAGAISSIPSPMVAHARLLRRWFGEDIGVVFIGPCIAKKMEADQYPELVDLALTFEEAAAWIAEEEDALSEAEPKPEEKTPDFVPFRAGRASLFPVDGGMIRAMEETGACDYRFFHQSGASQVMDTLESIPAMREKNYFLELLSCEGGCINGPGTRIKTPLISRRAQLLETWEGRLPCSSLEYLPADVLDRTWSITVPEAEAPAEERIEETLKAMGKKRDEDRKDCGGCGYTTCREFAVAFLHGKAEKEMCVTEMRRIAQNKVSALLHTIPMGVVIVDSEMRIVECNQRFLKLFAGIPFSPDSGTLKRAEGRRIAAFIPDVDVFHALLERGDTLERIIKADAKVMRGNFFQIQEGHFVGAVFQDITAPAVKREMVVKKAEEVIRKNLESVQQIAGLLGENAAETEIILNSLINAFEPGELKSDE